MRALRQLIVAIVIAASPHVADAADRRLPQYGLQQFKLLMSEDDHLCNHMGEVFNKNFAHFNYDFQRSAKGEPTAPEYEAVPWQTVATQGSEGLPKTLRVAKVDIDNDGQLDVVIKMSSFGSYPGSNDLYYIFPELGIDFTGDFLRWDDVYRMQDEHPAAAILATEYEHFLNKLPRVSPRGSFKPAPDLITVGRVSGRRVEFTHPIVIRLFIYEGQTYISLYTQYMNRATAWTEKIGVLISPRQWMIIAKYLGRPAGEINHTQDRLNDRCYFVLSKP
ncbi:MAG: hypothetical protein ABJA60_13095 [Nitrosospira sp.]